MRAELPNSLSLMVFKRMWSSWSSTSPFLTTFTQFAREYSCQFLETPLIKLDGVTWLVRILWTSSIASLHIQWSPSVWFKDKLYYLFPRVMSRRQTELHQRTSPSSLKTLLSNGVDKLNKFLNKTPKMLSSKVTTPNHLLKLISGETRVKISTPSASNSIVSASRRSSSSLSRTRAPTPQLSPSSRRKFRQLALRPMRISNISRPSRNSSKSLVIHQLSLKKYLNNLSPSCTPSS